jgi:hypothetical protein
MEDDKSLSPNADPTNFLLDFGNDFPGHQSEASHNSKRPSLLQQTHRVHVHCIRKQQEDEALQNLQQEQPDINHPFKNLRQKQPPL